MRAGYQYMQRQQLLFLSHFSSGLGAMPVTSVGPSFARAGKSGTPGGEAGGGEGIMMVLSTDTAADRSVCTCRIEGTDGKGREVIVRV